MEDPFKDYKADNEAQKALGNCLGVGCGFIAALIICIILSMCNGQTL